MQFFTSRAGSNPPSIRREGPQSLTTQMERLDLTEQYKIFDKLLDNDVDPAQKKQIIQSADSAAFLFFVHTLCQNLQKLEIVLDEISKEDRHDLILEFFNSIIENKFLENHLEKFMEFLEKLSNPQINFIFKDIDKKLPQNFFDNLIQNPDHFQKFEARIDKESINIDTFFALFFPHLKDTTGTRQPTSQEIKCLEILPNNTIRKFADVANNSSSSPALLQVNRGQRLQQLCQHMSPDRIFDILNSSHFIAEPERKSLHSCLKFEKLISILKEKYDKRDHTTSFLSLFAHMPRDLQTLIFLSPNLTNTQQVYFLNQMLPEKLVLTLFEKRGPSGISTCPPKKLHEFLPIMAHSTIGKIVNYIRRVPTYIPAFQEALDQLPYDSHLVDISLIAGDLIMGCKSSSIDKCREKIRDGFIIPSPQLSLSNHINTTFPSWNTLFSDQIIYAYYADKTIPADKNIFIPRTVGFIFERLEKLIPLLSISPELVKSFKNSIFAYALYKTLSIIYRDRTQKKITLTSHDTNFLTGIDELSNIYNKSFSRDDPHLAAIIHTVVDFIVQKAGAAS